VPSLRTGVRGGSRCLRRLPFLITTWRPQMNENPVLQQLARAVDKTPRAKNSELPSMHTPPRARCQTLGAVMHNDLAADVLPRAIPHLHLVRP
jgi:hypothetical protein